MKIKVNEEEVLDLPVWKEKVIQNDIKASEFDSDMKRRVKYALEHKFERCYERFEKEWLEKLRKDPSVNSIPTDKEAFVNLVIARQDYKDRDARDIEREP